MVLSNCSHSWGCDFCSNYSDYQPINKSILSPRQIQRKQEKKQKKDTDASKRGKAAKRKGGRIERELKTLLISWGYSTEKQPLSGSLKGKFSHDLITEINGKQRRIESKAWESLVGYHKRYGQCIDGLCVILSQEQFRCLLLGDIPEIIQSSDELKQLHEFFNQDKYTDIVAIKTRGKPFIFCLSLNFFNELKEGG